MHSTQNFAHKAARMEIRSFIPTNYKTGNKEQLRMIRFNNG